MDEHATSSRERLVSVTFVCVFCEVCEKNKLET